MTGTRPVLSRYLYGEALRSWAAVTTVLLAIMLATRLARFLAQAAKGSIDPSLLLVLVGLSSVRYLTILIPISLLIGVMLTLGRLYRDSEVAAMQSGGLGMGGLYGPFLRLGIMLALLGAVLSLWLSPLAGRTADFLVKSAANTMAFTALEAGRFRDLPEGLGTIYLEDVNPDEGALNRVFAEVDTPEQSSILIARRGQFGEDAEGRYRLMLEDGSRLDLDQRTQELRLTRFGQHGLAVAPPAFDYTLSKTSLKPTGGLLGSADPADLAEFHWRMATPLCTILLVLIAVPLSRTSARKGRYGQLGWGVLCFVIYFNALGLGQAWLEGEQLPAWMGLWWAHLVVAAIGCGLWLRAGRYRERLQQGLL